MTGAGHRLATAVYVGLGRRQTENYCARVLPSMAAGRAVRGSAGSSSGCGHLLRAADRRVSPSARRVPRIRRDRGSVRSGVEPRQQVPHGVLAQRAVLRSGGSADRRPDGSVRARDRSGRSRTIVLAGRRADPDQRCGHTDNPHRRARRILEDAAALGSGSGWSVVASSRLRLIPDICATDTCASAWSPRVRRPELPTRHTFGA